MDYFTRVCRFNEQAYFQTQRPPVFWHSIPEGVHDHRNSDEMEIPQDNRRIFSRQLRLIIARFCAGALKAAERSSLIDNHIVNVMLDLRARGVDVYKTQAFADFQRITEQIFEQMFVESDDDLPLTEILGRALGEAMWYLRIVYINANPSVTKTYNDKDWAKHQRQVKHAMLVCEQVEAYMGRVTDHPYPWDSYFKGEYTRADAKIYLNYREDKKPLPKSKDDDMIQRRPPVYNTQHAVDHNHQPQPIYDSFAGRAAPPQQPAYMRQVYEQQMAQQPQQPQIQVLWDPTYGMWVDQYGNQLPVDAYGNVMVPQQQPQMVVQQPQPQFSFQQRRPQRDPSQMTIQTNHQGQHQMRQRSGTLDPADHVNPQMFRSLAEAVAAYDNDLEVVRQNSTAAWRALTAQGVVNGRMQAYGFTPDEYANHTQSGGAKATHQGRMQASAPGAEIDDGYEYTNTGEVCYEEDGFKFLTGQIHGFNLHANPMTDNPIEPWRIEKRIKVMRERYGLMDKTEGEDDQPVTPVQRQQPQRPNQQFDRGELMSRFADSGHLGEVAETPVQADPPPRRKPTAADDLWRRGVEHELGIHREPTPPAPVIEDEVETPQPQVPQIDLEDYAALKAEVHDLRQTLIKIQNAIVENFKDDEALEKRCDALKAENRKQLEIMKNMDKGLVKHKEKIARLEAELDLVAEIEHHYNLLSTWAQESGYNPQAAVAARQAKLVKEDIIISPKALKDAAVQAALEGTWSNPLDAFDPKPVVDEQPQTTSTSSLGGEVDRVFNETLTEMNRPIVSDEDEDDDDIQLVSRASVDFVKDLRGPFKVVDVDTEAIGYLRDEFGRYDEVVVKKEDNVKYEELETQHFFKPRFTSSIMTEKPDREAAVRAFKRIAEQETLAERLTHAEASNEQVTGDDLSITGGIVVDADICVDEGTSPRSVLTDYAREHLEKDFMDRKEPKTFFYSEVSPTDLNEKEVAVIGKIKAAKTFAEIRSTLIAAYVTKQVRPAVYIDLHQRITDHVNEILSVNAQLQCWIDNFIDDFEELERKLPSIVESEEDVAEIMGCVDLVTSGIVLYEVDDGEGTVTYNLARRQSTTLIDVMSTDLRLGMNGPVGLIRQTTHPELWDAARTLLSHRDPEIRFTRIQTADGKDLFLYRYLLGVVETYLCGAAPYYGR